jgi:hypothetical protein
MLGLFRNQERELRTMSDSDQRTPEDQDVGTSEPGFTTVPLAPGRPLDLYVENPNGNIAIAVADRADVLVRWQKHGRPGSPWYDEANVQVSNEDDNRIGVKVALPPYWPRGDFSRSVLKFLEGGLKGDIPFAGLSGARVTIDLSIEVPRAHVTADPVRLRVRTANGDVRIDGVPGTIDVATANGEVGMNDIHGEISVHAANGDLAFDRPQGRLTARTVNGDLAVNGGDLGRFTLTTVSGDVRIEAALAAPGDTSRIESVNGDVNLDLAVPAATGATISVKTVSGDTDVSSPFRSIGKRTWRIGPGDNGGPSIAIKTVSGDLHAHGTLVADAGPARGPIDVAPPTPPAPPAQPAPPAPFADAAPTVPIKVDPRLAVLRAVERGEIDIDEAMRRLEGLDPSA